MFMKAEAKHHIFNDYAGLHCISALEYNYNCSGCSDILIN